MNSWWADNYESNILHYYYYFVMFVVTGGWPAWGNSLLFHHSMFLI